jgi:hypothetical protein
MAGNAIGIGTRRRADVNGLTLSFTMLVCHSRTCDVSALRLCLFPLELMNGREITTAELRAHVTCDW